MTNMSMLTTFIARRVNEMEYFTFQQSAYVCACIYVLDIASQLIRILL